MFEPSLHFNFSSIFYSLSALYVLTDCWEDGSNWPWLPVEDLHECAWFLNSRISNKPSLECLLYQPVSSVQEG